MAKKIINSTLYDSDDENQVYVSKTFRSDPAQFSQHILTLGKTKDYPVTAILTELGNRILLDEQIDNIYQQYKDPLQFQVDRFQSKINFLAADLELAKTTISYLAESSLNPNNHCITDKSQLIDQHKKKILELEAKQAINVRNFNDLKLLKKERDNLAIGNQYRNIPPLKGAFQFIPKRLSETFCENCREKLPNTFKNLDNIEIQKYFVDLRIYLQDFTQNKQNNEYNDVSSIIFGKPVQLDKRTNAYSKSSGFLDAVISKIGEYNENDVAEYVRLNNLDQTDSKEILQTLNSYIKDNLEKIYELTEKTAHYSLNPKYLKTISNIENNILAQTRLYYKIHRDINKNTLVLGNEGQRNYPPGLNTTATIFSTGSNALFLGELGSYADISERNLHTLKMHIMQNTISEEKSGEFRSLMQIEALRSTASLITNSMFFYLSQPGNEFINITGVTYKRNKIDKLMPMAMKGAVGGIIFIENEVSKELSSRMTYDYRHINSSGKISAELLEIRNHHLMFDFVCADSGIIDRNTGKIIDIDGSLEWNIKKDSLTKIITARKDDYEFELQENNGEQKISKIKSFPAKIIQDLLVAEYGTNSLEFITNCKFEVEINSIASKQLRDLNIKLLELENNKQLGNISFNDQEITNIRKDFDQLSLSLFEITSTEKSKKNTEVKNNDSNYHIFKEKLSNLSNVLSPEKIVQNLKENIDFIHQNVKQKPEDNNKKLLLNNIENIKKDLSTIDDTTKLKDFVRLWEDFKQTNKQYLQITGKRTGAKINKSSKKSKPNNSHLKQHEKDNLSKSNNEKNYNLSKAIKDINLDNTVLLASIKNINRKSVIESNIVMKAFDTVPDINSTTLETHVKLDLLLEDNHLTNHRNNISTIVKKIDSGEIGGDCIILLERKQYGNNLGIQDVIKLANILKYNEKNPNQNIKLPEEINSNSLIYQDAVMYKTASEKNIKVIGLEGKNLEARKNSPNYNENREHYMANVIYQLNRRGYSVIAMIGSSHKDNIRAEFEKLQLQNKGIASLNKISRNIQSAYTPSNNEATIYANKLGDTLKHHVSKKHLPPTNAKNISNTKKYKTSLLSK